MTDPTESARLRTFRSLVPSEVTGEVACGSTWWIGGSGIRRMTWCTLQALRGAHEPRTPILGDVNELNLDPRRDDGTRRALASW